MVISCLPIDISPVGGSVSLPALGNGGRLHPQFLLLKKKKTAHTLVRLKIIVTPHISNT